MFQDLIVKRKYLRRRIGRTSLLTALLRSETDAESSEQELGFVCIAVLVFTGLRSREHHHACSSNPAEHSSGDERS